MSGPLDEVAVFSDKDAQLLGDPPNLRVIRPPLASGDETMPPPPPGPPALVFVAHFKRPVNDDAALWFLREVWPSVERAVPGVRLRLVGADASDTLSAEAARWPSVTLTGFVDDRGAEYRAAALAVVPLRRGAGVKFKTIEALLHGAPVVTTPVGAEGVEGPDLFAVAEPEPKAFGAAVVALSRRPGRRSPARSHGHVLGGARVLPGGLRGRGRPALRAGATSRPERLGRRETPREGLPSPLAVPGCGY